MIKNKTMDRNTDYIRFTASNEEFLEKADFWIEEHRNPEYKTLLILDELQWVVHSEKQI